MPYMECLYQVMRWHGNAWESFCTVDRSSLHPAGSICERGLGIAVLQELDTLDLLS